MLALIGGLVVIVAVFGAFMAAVELFNNREQKQPTIQPVALPMVHPIRCYQCSVVNRFSFYQLIYRARELGYESHTCSECGKIFTVKDAV